VSSVDFLEPGDVGCGLQQPTSPLVPKDGFEEICAMRNGVGVGIARFPSTGGEAAALRQELQAVGLNGSAGMLSTSSFTYMYM
jgi:hypothetical protein